MDNLLKDLGLTEHEVKVYKMLLDNGPSLAGIVTRKTGIHRRNVYDCLERLIQKGLVGYIKSNYKKEYSVKSPEVILHTIRQKEKEWESLMPQMMAKFGATQEKSETLIFRGKNGIRMVFEDQILEGKEVLVQSTSTDVEEILKFFFPKYELLRKENKIPMKMLIDESLKKKDRMKRIPLCENRYLKGFNSSATSEYIYGNKVAIVVWGDDPVAIVIDQKEIANAHREKFTLLWNMAK